MSTVIICIVIAVICAYAVFSYAKKIKGGCCGGGGSDIRIKPDDTNTSHYPYMAIVHIDGMTCSHCKMRVENAFNNIDGCYAKVNLKKNFAEVLSKHPIDNESLRRIVEGAGYTFVKAEIEK